MSTSTSSQTVFHLDQEHSGVRYAVILILLLSFTGAFAAVSFLLRAFVPTLNTTAILSCLAAIPISLLISAVGEWLLKRSWHSGRMLMVDDERITLQLPETADREIYRRKTVNTLWWHLPLAGYARGGRERRIPAKWYCMAGQLQQDETRIVVYSYATPERRQRWVASFEFAKLSPDDVYKTSFSSRLGAPNRPDIPPDVIAGRHGRFWLGERNRWREGVELTQDDFEQLLNLTRLNGA